MGIKASFLQTQPPAKHARLSQLPAISTSCIHANVANTHFLSRSKSALQIQMQLADSSEYIQHPRLCVLRSLRSRNLSIRSPYPATSRKLGRPLRHSQLRGSKHMPKYLRHVRLRRRQGVQPSEPARRRARQQPPHEQSRQCVHRIWGGSFHPCALSGLHEYHHASTFRC
jgi:hypothetical protein